MPLHTGLRACFVLAAFLAACGCASSPPAEQPEPPQAPDQGMVRVIEGAGDSVAAIPGSPDAIYRFRFRQVDPPSERFTFQDRELSFYMKPTPDALHFQIENRQDRPVWIDWDKCVFYDPDGRTGKLAHSTTRWDARFQAQAATQIPGLQRYGDYVLPLDYLLDPAGAPEQPHRPLFPEDNTAAQYAGKSFGVDFAFMIEDQPRLYSFRFRVASLITR